VCAWMDGAVRCVRGRVPVDDDDERWWCFLCFLCFLCLCLVPAAAPGSAIAGGGAGVCFGAGDGERSLRLAAVSARLSSEPRKAAALFVLLIGGEWLSSLELPCRAGGKEGE